MEAGPVEEEALATLLAVTGCEDPARARQLLEAANGDLNQATELFFTTGGNTPAAPAGGAVAGGAVTSPGVRAADAVRTERLYGDAGDPSAGLQHYAAAGPAPPPRADPFRSFDQEDRARWGGGGGGAGGSGLGGAGGGGGGGGESALGAMYKPPTDLSFEGDLEQAKDAAAREDKWLLINVQSSLEFASQLLNRDTWSNAGVRATVSSAFVFWQVEDTTADGMKLKDFYRLSTLPVVMVVDPITGQKVRFFEGFVDPEVICEDLAPYLDSPPSRGPPKLSKNITQGLLAKRKLAVTGQAGGPGEEEPRAGKGKGRAGRDKGLDGDNLTEDEQLALAIQASLEASKGKGGANAGEPDAAAPPPGPAEAEAAAETVAVAVEETAEERAAAAAAALPEEPAAGDPAGCRVLVRVPDGARLERRFPRDAPASALHAFCVTRVAEAQQGRGFRLKPQAQPVGPGGEPLGPGEARSIAACGVANSMLLLVWD